MESLSWLAVLIAGAVACAGSTGSQGDATMRSTASAQTVEDVRVERDGSHTVVTLSGLDHPVFTAFAQMDPDRVVVDVSSADTTAPGSVGVNDGLVREVVMAPYETSDSDPMLRVEVVLDAEADYEVNVVPGGLAIRVMATSDTLANQASVDDPIVASEYDPWAPDAGGTASNDSPTSVPASSDWASDAPAPSVPAAVPASPATRLLAVSSQQSADGTIIELAADGTIESVVAFTLDDPPRLVVDLPDLSSEANDRVEVGSARVSRVRIGEHPGKVRIVVDGGDAADAFGNRQIVPTPGGLMIALGSGPQIDAAIASAASAPAPASGQLGTLASVVSGEVEAPARVDDHAMAGLADAIANQTAGASSDPWADVSVTEAPATAAAPVSPSDTGLAAVYGIEFDSQETRDRIVVLGDQAMDYFVFEPEPNTVIVTLDGARIDPEAAVRITPEPGGPVSLVTAFEQPELETPEVRLVVQRAPNLKPEVSRRGSLLIIDFPNTGGVAAAPPVMNTQPNAPLLGADGEPQMASMAAEAGMPAVSSGEDDFAPASYQPTDDGMVPAALEGGAAIDVLQEGGLVEGKQYSGRRISLDFKDVDIADVLRLIAEVSELNVIAGDEVKGKVTIRLVDVPWDQALDVVLLTKGLGFMRVGNVLRIAPSNVIQQEEEMRLQERRAKEKLEDLIVKLQPVNYADVGVVKTLVEKLLSPRGTVNTDERTNTLILKDIPSVVDEATALVKAIDTQTPQVMIEAKIVEASLDFSREFGATWGIGAQPLTDGFDAGSASRQDLGNSNVQLHDQNTFFTQSSGNNAVFANPITANPTGLFNMAAFLLDQKLNLELQLQAAEVNGDGKVISSPRVVTLDNSEATIEQGVSIPFQTFENGDAQLEFVDAVLKLQVKPHITADQSIIMEIAVNRNAPDDSVFTLTGSPAIAKNQVKTETLVKDGQTLVLGGIYVIDKSQRQSRVPYLHSIPLLGAAFRSDEHSESRKELLIFVTPRVVVGAEDA